MADCSCRYALDLCSDCDGLRVLRQDLLTGVTGITITYTDGRTEHTTPGEVWLSRVPEPCTDRPGATDRG